jgi:hypothetical protein
VGERKRFADAHENVAALDCARLADRSSGLGRFNLLAGGAMNLNEFIKAVDNLVRDWATDKPYRGAVPRAQLGAIYNELCEQAVHDVAVRVGPTLHKHYMEGEDERPRPDSRT